ncbi:MAG: MlaD family protein [Gemmataceae bacterium]
MTQRGMRIRLGMFVFLACVLFGSLIVMFNSLPGFFRVSSTYIVRFTDAPGLAPGAPVRRSGVRIGEVRDIILDEERGIVRVYMAIRSPYTVRKNEIPTLMTGLLGSDATIDFLPRSEEEGDPVDRGPVEPGSELVGTRAATFSSLLKGASDVVPSAQETLNEIRKSIQRIEKLAGRVEKSIPIAEDTMRAYRQLAQRTEASIPELEKTNRQIQELLTTARDVVPEVQRTADAYRQLARNADAAIPEVLRTNREIAEVVRGVNNALPTIESTAEEFRDLASDIRKMRPRIEGVIDDVGSTARSANRLMEEFDVFWRKNRDVISDSFASLGKSLEQVSKMVGDENVQKVNRAITNISTASDSFPKISQNVTDISEQGKTTVRRVNDSLSKVEKPLDDVSKVMTDIQKFVQNANSALTNVQSVITDVQRTTKPLGDRAGAITRNVDESLEKVNATLGDIRGLMRTLDRSDGLLKKVLTDPSLYNNLDQAAVMVVKMIPRIDHILKDFEVFADKLARHPESLGIGGVVRPGNGLKNPPTPPINQQPQVPPGTPIFHSPLSPRR